MKQQIESLAKQDALAFGLELRIREVAPANLDATIDRKLVAPLLDRAKSMQSDEDRSYYCEQVRDRLMEVAPKSLRSEVWTFRDPDHVTHSLDSDLLVKASEVVRNGDEHDPVAQQLFTTLAQSSYSGLERYVANRKEAQETIEVKLALHVIEQSEAVTLTKQNKPK